MIAALGACALASASAVTAIPALDARALAAESQSPLEDQGSSPNYRSLITSVSPAVGGVSLQVLQFSDRLQLRNASGQTVTIVGYQGEPYARVRADGTVEVNKRSPAYFLNQSFYGNVTVPPSASPSATPRWTVVDRTGQFEWHDHRIHWMSPVLPPQVKDKSKRTLIFDWRVPIDVGSRHGNVDGQLFWTPQTSSTPIAAIVIGGAIVVLGLALVLFTRRRRGRPQGPSGGARTHVGQSSGSREAW
jgi:LPXTG-motif cell wall-anchored protein